MMIEVPKLISPSLFINIMIKLQNPWGEWKHKLPLKGVFGRNFIISELRNINTYGTNMLNSFSKETKECVIYPKG